MKLINVESSIGLDRLATRDEVRCASLLSSHDAFGLLGAQDDFLDMDSDFGVGAGNLHEDTMWLAIVGEMLDSVTN